MDAKEAVLNYGRVTFEISENGDVQFRLRGELDHHSVKEIREIIDSKLIDYRPANVALNLDEVSFTDSAGLGLVLGRYTRITGYGGSMMLREVPDEFMKILKLAGTDKFIKIEKKQTIKKDRAVR